MKKIKPYLINIGFFIGAFIIYTFIQELYFGGQSLTLADFVIDVILVVFCTILGLMLVWMMYRWGIKEHNPLKFDQKPHFKWKRIGLTILGCIILLIVQLYFSALLQGQQPENEMELYVIQSQSGPLFYWMVILVGPIFEELIFRGILLNIILRVNTWANKYFAIVFGGLIFGLVHEPRLSFYLLIYWSMGMILTAVYVFTKDLRYPILVHIFNNAISMM